MNLLLREAAAAAFVVLALASFAGATTIEVGGRGGQIATIQAAIDRAAAGDRIVIHAGVYRETVHVGVSGTAEQKITIEAAPGSHPVITGADVIPAKQWRPVAGTHIWCHQPWTYHAPSRVLNGKTYVTEQLIEDGKLLAGAPSLKAMKPGSFFAD